MDLEWMTSLTWSVTTWPIASPTSVPRERRSAIARPTIAARAM